MKKEHRKLRRRPMFAPLLAPMLGGVVAVLLLAWLWSERGVSTVIVVRHADVQQVEGQDPTLSDTGIYRSKALAGWLRDAGLARIYVSDYAPTRETAGPAARASDAEIVEIPGDQLETLIEALDDLRDETVLVIARREAMPEIIHALAGRRPEIPEADYSSLFIIDDSLLSRARLLSLHYGG